MTVRARIPWLLLRARGYVDLDEHSWPDDGGHDDHGAALRNLCVYS